MCGDGNTSSRLQEGIFSYLGCVLDKIYLVMVVCFVFRVRWCVELRS